MMAKRVWLYGLLAFAAPAAAETIEVELSGADGRVIASRAIDDASFARDGVVELPAEGGDSRRFDVRVKRRSANELVRDGGGFAAVRREATTLAGESTDGWTLRGIYGEGRLTLQLSDGSSTRYVATPGAHPARLFDALAQVEARGPVEEAVAPMPAGTPASEVSSPVDPVTGKVVLRHVGLFITLTEALCKTVDPQFDFAAGGSVPVNNFMIGLGGWLDDALRANANVTVTAIGSGVKGDFLYSCVPDAGFGGQPANSVFANVAFTRTAWSLANHAYQQWSMSMFAGLDFWDAGIAIGINGPNPAGGTTAHSGACTTQRGEAYVGIHPVDLATSLSTGDWFPSGHGVIHEFGHLLGASHTFTSNTGSCAAQITPGSDFEIGAGRTFMGYLTGCGQAHDPNGGLPVFHAASLHLVDAKLDALEAGAAQVPAQCISRDSTTNTPVKLIVGAPASPRWIPKNAGFTLSAYAIDPDPYVENKSSFFAPPGGYTGCGSTLGIGEWNQMDSPSAGAMPPRFRTALTRCRQTFSPPIIPPPSSTINRYFSRFFPPAGNPDPFDPGADVVGTMHFRATAWDINQDGGSGVPSHATADLSLVVKPELAPTFSAPVANSFVKAGQAYTIKWTPTPSTVATPSFAELRAAVCSPSLGKCRGVKTVYGASGATNALDIVIPSTVSGKSAYVVITYQVDGSFAWHAFSQTFQVQP